MKTQEILVSESYASVLEQIKQDIRQAQIKALLSVTKDLTQLYWRIGNMISQKISDEGWGAKTIERLAKDLGTSFPGVTGFSLRNLRYMRKFAESYPKSNFATAVAKLPWGHNIVLLERLNEIEKEFGMLKKRLKADGAGTCLLSGSNPIFMAAKVKQLLISKLPYLSLFLTWRSRY